MPLRKKLILLMVIPALLLGIVGVVGISSLQHLREAAGKILADNYQSIQEARRMESALRTLETYSLNEGDPDAHQPEHPESLIGVFEDALSRCDRNITEKGEQATLQRIREAWNRYKPKLLEPDAASGMDQLRSSHRLTASLYEDIDALVELNEKAMFTFERETRRVAKLMTGGVIGSSVAAVLALALFALISANRISRPVVQVANRLHGALNPEVGAGSQKSMPLDEIQLLREELDDLLSRLARYEDEQKRKLMHLQGRLAFVINEVMEGLVLLDSEHRILAVNRVARAILGVENDEGVRLADLQPREDVKRLLDPLVQGTFQPERDLGEIRYEVGGEERVYRPRVLTLTAGDGGIEGYLVLFWDVTEQKQFEESRRQFISMLSHQLKTPMTSLSMSVNMLKEKLTGLSPAQAELLSIATDNCNSLSGLIAELINAAREVTANLTIRYQRIELVRLLGTTLRPLRPQAEEKEIELVLPSAEKSVSVCLDPVKFSWVVANIVGNALRYTGRGGRIVVSVRPVAEHIEVTVSDTGKGIANEDIEHIFSPFVSIDSKPHPGTHGLGLAIAKEIVEAHRGTIEVESEVDRGTTFRIRLPLNAGETA
jgi:NtrC-family two-component system sensor histidine kinase KinB